MTLVSEGGKKNQKHNMQDITYTSIEKDVMQPKQTTCPHCTGVFSTEKRMKCHMSLEHELQGNKVLQIEVTACTKERFNTIPEVTMCPYCANVFSTNKRMKCHMSLVHELQPMKKETKKHLCPTCEKLFIIKGFLFNHMKAAHNIEKTDAVKIELPSSNGLGVMVF